MKTLHLTILVSLLVALGMGVFLYKATVLGFPLFSDAHRGVWKIEARVRFQAQNKPARISLYIPGKNDRFAIVNEMFISHGFGINTKFEDGNRVASWSIRKADGRHTLFYQATVREQEQTAAPVQTRVPEVMYHGFEEVEMEAAEALIAEIRDKSADMETFVAELFRRLSAPDVMKHFTPDVPDVSIEESRLNVAVRLLSLSGFPARAVHGCFLEPQKRDAPLVHWLEYYQYNRWIPFDPISGGSKLNKNYLVWWRGPWGILSTRGVKDSQIVISVDMDQEEGIVSAVERGKIRNPMLVRFSLFSLPIETQMVYRILLLIPIGVFLLLLMRNIIGVKTYGTFMPVLIALAFRETRLIGGIVMFTLVVGIGMSIRLYLERLKLLVVPRLASVLIVVILLLMFLSIVLHKLGIEQGLSVALFPMVIMTMIIERSSIVWEEMGPSEAVQQGLGTLVVAALSYLVMRISFVEHVVFVFPELLLVLLGATLLMGRYSGYRLAEFWRFKDLIKSRSHV